MGSTKLHKPNLNSLKMFDAAARHLNFRLAAEELHLTQGAVAQQVRRLESNLGLQLFHRKARGLELTVVGRNYHKTIRRALGMIDDATRKLVPESTSVTLSITPSFASKWLVPRLASFSEAHPSIDVQTVASEGLANFQTDRVDLAIRQGHPPFGEALYTELLTPVDLRAVCNPDFAEEFGPFERLDDFANLPLIQDSHNLWDSLLEEAGLSARNKVIQFNQTALAMDAAANGQGIALAPRILITMDLELGRLVEIWRDTRNDQAGYFVVYPRNRVTDTARDALIDWTKLEIKRADSL
ncbi:MAG: LysR substrate-binding domain-containing protein [Pseudomonadota bacterium]